MTQPLDLHFDGARSRPLLPRVAFWVALLIVASICGALRAHWWHFAVGILSVVLVRVTTWMEVV